MSLKWYSFMVIVFVIPIPKAYLRSEPSQALRPRPRFKCWFLGILLALPLPLRAGSEPPHRTTENVTSFLFVIVVIDPDQQIPFLAAPSSRAPHLTGLQHFCHQITSRYMVPRQTLSLMKTLPKGIKRWACMFYISPRALLLVIYITASEYSKCIYKCHHLQRLFVYCS